MICIVVDIVKSMTSAQKTIESAKISLAKNFAAQLNSLRSFRGFIVIRVLVIRWFVQGRDETFY